VFVAFDTDASAGAHANLIAHARLVRPFCLKAFARGESVRWEAMVRWHVVWRVHRARNGRDP
jgi:hypothetical protein